MDTSTVWSHIHRERRALARILAEIDDAEWEAPTLCPGWSVKDVAAHVISNPQIRWRDMGPMTVRNLGRGYNDMIFREVRRLGAQQSRDQILADFVTYDGSTRHVPTTTVIEPLIDALVHTQDIVRPLGRHRDMPPEAAAVAADRCRRLAFLMGSRRIVRSVRMEAEDADWARGRGPVLRGPMQELLMVCSGRAAAPGSLSGEGADVLDTLLAAR